MTGERSPYSGREVTAYLDDEYKLYDVEGDEVGRIVEINDAFVVVERGGGFLSLGEKETIFVPRNAIEREEGEKWYLSIEEDAIDGMGWRERPADYEAREADYVDDRRSARDGTSLVRYEEDLEAQKVAREAGEVTIGKRVVEDSRTVEVPVRREEVHVERHPVSGETTTQPTGEAFTEDRITVPVMEEDVEVRKVARPVEEVEINKTGSQETRRVEDTVRREEFDVDDRTNRSRTGAARDEELR